MRRALLRWAPAVSWAGLLFWLGAQSGDKIPGGWWVSRYGLDKVAHAAAYAVLGFLTARATGSSRVRPALLAAAVAAAAVGALDEWNQQWSTGRYSEVLDWVADLAGGLLGGWVSTRLKKRARTAN